MSLKKVELWRFKDACNKNEAFISNNILLVFHFHYLFSLLPVFINYTNFFSYYCTVHTILKSTHVYYLNWEELLKLTNNSYCDYRCAAVARQRIFFINYISGLYGIQYCNYIYVYRNFTSRCSNEPSCYIFMIMTSDTNVHKHRLKHTCDPYCFIHISTCYYPSWPVYIIHGCK